MRVVVSVEIAASVANFFAQLFLKFLKELGCRDYENITNKIFINRNYSGFCFRIFNLSKNFHGLLFWTLLPPI